MLTSDQFNRIEIDFECKFYWEIKIWEHDLNKLIRKSKAFSFGIDPARARNSIYTSSHWRIVVKYENPLLVI